MSQEPKKKRNPKRHLNVEMMEARLLLSISPSGLDSLRDLTEVEFVPPPTEGASQIDMLDFGDMAQQFNDVHVFTQIKDIAPVPKLPTEDAGKLNLEDPAYFLSSTAEQTGQAAYSLADRLSDELASIDWSTTSSAEGSTAQVSPPVIIVTVPFPSSDASTAAEPDRIESDKLSVPHQEAERPFDTTEGDRNGIFTDGDFTKLDDRIFNDDSIDQDSLFNFELRPVQGERGGYDLAFSSDYFAENSIDISANFAGLDGMIGIDGVFLANYGDHNAIMIMLPNLVPGQLDYLGMQGGIASDIAGDFSGDFFVDDTYSPWGMPAKPGDIRGFIPDYSNNSWETQAPPTAHGANPRDALRATAGVFYQEMFDGNSTDTNSLSNTDKQDLAVIYDSPQTTSRVLSSTDDEGGTYEENLTLSEFSSGDGTITELDIDQLALLEKQANLETANLGIEGLMDTNPKELIVDAEASTGEEGGMIDFTAAMNWAQKPVSATAEGIVEAGIQQEDSKVAFEGSYGREQTFELATANEEEVSTPKDPTLEDVSAALLEDLNNTPLKSNAQENLDKTDINPTAHEMALREMNDELDYASMLPSEALSWATFAFVTQSTTRHPNERKKKK